MWIIFLKDKDDARDWGISTSLAAVVSQADDGPVCAKISSDQIDELAGTDDISLVVINGRRVAPIEQLLEALPADSRRVWIHFGSTNSDAPTFTRKVMATTWQERDLAQLKTLQNVPFNPFSMTSQTKWDCALQGLAAALQKALDNDAPHKEELHRRINGLGEAWSWANGYYDATQPFGAWVRAVFPLFLDAMGIELARSRGVDTDEWCREALEAYRTARKTMTSDLRLGGEEGLLARAEKVLGAAQSADHEELQRLFQDCREASELLEWLDEQAQTTFQIPGERAQKLLALSSLLRRLEQHYAI
jgi:hypothetical protein